VYADGVPIELRTKSGAKVRMETSGEVSAVPASGKVVKLGAVADGDLEAAALGDTIKSFMDTTKLWQDTHLHSGGTIFGLTGIPTVTSPTVPDVTSSNVKVKK
jgi:hypothetical protein